MVVRRSESVEACAELNESPWMWICDTMPESGCRGVVPCESGSMASPRTSFNLTSWYTGVL